jgi:predicted nucleic acid-binding protein
VADRYRLPYVESSVFIAWIKGERVTLNRNGVLETVDRGRISEHVLQAAEDGEYSVVSSFLTLAEVHKTKGHTKLEDDQNSRILKYFEHSFIRFVDLDRDVGEQANRLCRMYQKEKLSPNDAVHLASALRAKCEVLLTWDDGLIEVRHPDIRIERPRILGQGRLPGFSTFESPSDDDEGP